MIVEISVLNAFYQATVAWPRDEAELAAVVHRLATLVGAPVAAIYINDHGVERIASQLSNGLNRVAVEEVLKEEFRKPERPTRFRMLEGHQLMLAPIQASSIEELAERGPRHPETIGWA